MWSTARKVAGVKAWTSASLIVLLSGHIQQIPPLVPTRKLELHNPKIAFWSWRHWWNQGSAAGSPNQGTALLEKAVACSWCGFWQTALGAYGNAMSHHALPCWWEFTENLRRMTQSFDCYIQGYKATSQRELLPACQISGTAWAWTSSHPLAGQAQSCSLAALLPDSPMIPMIQALTQSRHLVRETSQLFQVAMARLGAALCTWPGMQRRPALSCLSQDLVCPTTPHTGPDGCLKRRCLRELLLDSNKDLKNSQEHPDVWDFLTLPTTGLRTVPESPNVEDWSP